VRTQAQTLTPTPVRVREGECEGRRDGEREGEPGHAPPTFTIIVNTKSVGRKNDRVEGECGQPLEVEEKVVSYVLQPSSSRPLTFWKEPGKLDPPDGQPARPDPKVIRSPSDAIGGRPVTLEGPQLSAPALN